MHDYCELCKDPGDRVNGPGGWPNQTRWFRRMNSSKRVDKNIYQTPYGTFRLHVQNGADKLVKTFETLAEAIEARDDFLKKHDLFIAPAPEGFQVCSEPKCRAVKPLTDFTPGYKRCKECINQYHRKRREDQDVRDYESEQRNARYASNPLGQKERHLRSKFGWTLDGYQQMGEDQGWLCAICFRPETRVFKGSGDRSDRVLSLAIDHDHEHDEAHTGALTACPECIRGLLCIDCNTMLGKLDDDPLQAIRVAEYLIEHKLRQGYDLEKAEILLSLKQIADLLESS